MDVSKLAPYAKFVVALGGALATTLLAIVAIASAFADGLLSADEFNATLASLGTIGGAWATALAVFRVPNKESE